MSIEWATVRAVTVSRYERGGRYDVLLYTQLISDVNDIKIVWQYPCMTVPLNDSTLVWQYPCMTAPLYDVTLVGQYPFRKKKTLHGGTTVSLYDIIPVWPYRLYDTIHVEQKSCMTVSLYASTLVGQKVVWQYPCMTVHLYASTPIITEFCWSERSACAALECCRWNVVSTIGSIFSLSLLLLSPYWSLI